MFVTRSGSRSCWSTGCCDTAAVLADDAQHRGWDSETERHLKLITRLNNLIDTTTTHPNTA